MYYINGKKYEKMGNAMLHMKALEDGKYQLLVRAENALGSILLNIKLVSGIPFNQMGKDIKMTVITKNPATPKDDTPTTVTYLIRSGCKDDAEEIMAMINKFLK